jgi:hypothetical protein
VTRIAERSDQSSWPEVEIGENGQPHVTRGPHNLIRRIVEFAIENEGVHLYVGSPAEIVGTMYVLGAFEIDSSALLFADDTDRLPLWQRPAAAADATELAIAAERLGLKISERTAHRILAGEFAPLESVLSLVTGADEEEPKDVSPDIYRDRRGLKLHATDIADFRRELTKAFDLISERYYLNLKSEPNVTVGKDRVTVRFEVEKDD